MSDSTLIEQTASRPFRIRPNEYDVTSRVCVSSAADVRDAVQAIFQQAFPGAAFDVLWVAFHDFERLFRGQYEDYLGCDTLYHDIQHTLDMSLAMARLLAGYEKTAAPADRLGHERAVIGLIAALFHDAGYIRRRSEGDVLNGAEFTGRHVTRSAEFLRRYLPQIGLAAQAAIAAQVVHFTGYEMSLDDIELDDPKDSLMGHLLGTADLMAQMADRCYLEKCRDRLYAEFVLAGVATQPVAGAHKVQYESGIDLLRQTPGFFRASVRERLDRKFNRAYRYIEAVCDGRNPYFEAIEQNLAHLDRIIEAGSWQLLRRDPPCFTALDNPLQHVSGLVSRYLARASLAPA
ncbi:MAG: HD domain-containing protein [Gammaproteobacteria bacterium]|nr:HD domain-containing protein [Gammaproteobacteria bacterium]